MPVMIRPEVDGEATPAIVSCIIGVFVQNSAYRRVTNTLWSLTRRGLEVYYNELRDRSACRVNGTTCRHQTRRLLGSGYEVHGR